MRFCCMYACTVGVFALFFGCVWVVFVPVPFSKEREKSTFSDARFVAVVLQEEEGACRLALQEEEELWLGVVPPGEQAQYAGYRQLLLWFFDTTHSKRSGRLGRAKHT